MSHKSQFLQLCPLPCRLVEYNNDNKDYNNYSNSYNLFALNIVAHPESQVAETTIDIDGSGPLAPFNVKCEFFPDGRNITYVRHKNEAPTKVDGFQVIYS